MADVPARTEIGVTTGPIRGSRKIHVGPLKVAMREITLEPVVPTHVKQKSAPAPVKKPAPSEPKTSTKLKQPSNAFALQVSTVTIKDNAYALRDKLRKAGYTAYVETRTSNGKTSYRVRIGPELDKSRLEKMKATIKKEQRLDGFIVNHP